MKRFKIGQTAYYYLENCGIGRIIACTIKQATKDLDTGKITYLVVSADENYSWINNRTLTSDYLYVSEKQIMKEHKDEMAYRVLEDKLDDINKALNRIMNEYAEKMTANPVSWATISAADTTASLYVEGIGNVQEEFNKIKKEVEILKKKIKKPTKKTVKKEEAK